MRRSSCFSIVITDENTCDRFSSQSQAIFHEFENLHFYMEMKYTNAQKYIIHSKVSMKEIYFMITRWTFTPLLILYCIIIRQQRVLEII